MSSVLEEWGKVFGSAFLGLSSWWSSLVAPVLGVPEIKVGEGPFTVSGTLRNPDGSVIPNAKLTLKDMHFYNVLATGTSSSEGKYCFTGVPRMNLLLEVEEPGKVKRETSIGLVPKVDGVPVTRGMVVPFDLTVPYVEAPPITYKITAPPVPEYKPLEYPAYVSLPERKPTVGYA